MTQQKEKTATIKVFNNDNLISYLKKCWNIFEANDITSLRNSTFVKLCSSHSSKIIRNDMKKFYGKKRKNDINLLSELIGAIYNIKDFDKLKEYWAQLSLLLKCHNKCNNYKTAIKNCAKIIDKNANFGEEMFETEKNDITITETIFDNKYNTVIYKESPFYKEFKCIYDETPEFQNENMCINGMKCEPFVQHF